MTEAFERVKRDFRGISQKLHEMIAKVAGQPLKFTLIVWDNDVWSEGASETRQNPKRWGLNSFRGSTLPPEILPDALRALADQIEQEAKQPAHQ
jgi:hypothetical protein